MASTTQQNTESNEFQLEHIITSLTDPQRENLFDLCNSLIGNKFSLKRTQENNSFSPFYIDMDGENLRYGSTGTRLLLTLLGILLNDRFSVIMVDEPELGLSPRIQNAIVRFMYSEDERRTFCPHLKNLYVATHSHLFLDRRTLSNNFALTKTGPNVSIEAVHSVADLHQLQFSMLGNELEAIFLPSAIVMAEGVSDIIFLNKLVRLHISEKKIAVVRLGGEGQLIDKLHFLAEAFGNLTLSPYRNRIFVLLDNVRSTRNDRIVAAGVPAANIKILAMNGIEYYYPKELTASAFHCNERDIADIRFENDPIEYNGIRLSKRQLAEYMSENVDASNQVNEELQEFLKQVSACCA